MNPYSFVPIVAFGKVNVSAGNVTCNTYGINLGTNWVKELLTGLLSSVLQYLIGEYNYLKRFNKIAIQ